MIVRFQSSQSLQRVKYSPVCSVCAGHIEERASGVGFSPLIIISDRAVRVRQIQFESAELGRQDIGKKEASTWNSNFDLLRSEEGPALN